MAKSKVVSLRPSDAVDDIFDQDEWMYPASDKNGQSCHIHFRVKPHVARMVQEIISQRKFPYGTDSDLYRHALMAHLHRLTKEAGCPEAAKGLWKQLIFMQTQQREEMAEIEFTKTLTELGEYVNKAMAKGGGAIVRVRDFVKRQHELVQEMPKGFWRNHFLKEFEQRFGYLLPKEMEDGEEG